MTKDQLTIAGKDYLLKELSTEAKNTLASIQLVDRKIIENKQQMAILQTARNTYVNTLKGLLPKEIQ